MSESGHSLPMCVVPACHDVRSSLDCVAKVESCRVTNLSRKHEAGSNRRFVQTQSRCRSRLRL